MNLWIFIAFKKYYQHQTILSNSQINRINGDIRFTLRTQYFNLNKMYVLILLF